MAVNDRKRDLLSQRRRVHDEGEDDELAEDMGDDSLSEASVLTLDDNATGEASDMSETENVESSGTTKQANGHKNKATREESNNVISHPVGNGVVASHQAEESAFKSTADMDVMTNGLKPSANGTDTEILEFEATAADAVPTAGEDRGQDQSKSSQLHIPKAPKSKLQSQATLQPALRSNVNQPTQAQSSVGRGQAFGGGRNAHLPFHPAQRGGVRGRGLGVHGLGNPQRPLPPHAPASEARWSHDLHETVLAPGYMANRTQPTTQNHIRPLATQASQTESQLSKPSPMSKSIALGMVAARIFLPSMVSPLISDKKIVIRQHTRLPDLRPPLRRDKPVRISIPEHAPRYVFPSIDRSFIFIPRAQRPNQQRKSRGRGYGSRGGSRRTSAYGGSVYSPSIGMSRRSSTVPDGMMSPAGSAFGRAPPGAPTGPARPVVRLPSGPRARMYSQSFVGPEEAIEMGYPLPSEPVRREHRSSQMPMHQPRPQKQMSVASIEGEQQAFHQQLPFPIPGQPAPDQQTQAAAPTTYHGQSSVGTPLPNIPEGAINAQPFQPTHDPNAYFTYPPHPQPMYYYPLPENQHYPNPYGMPPLASPVYLQPAPYYMPMLMPVPIPGVDNSAAPNAYMQENNGMVYYYDASQFQPPNDGDGPGSGPSLMQPPTGPETYYAPTPQQGANTAFYP